MGVESKMDGDGLSGQHVSIVAPSSNVEIWEPLDDSLHRDSRFESREMSTQTEVRAEAKSEVPGGLARDVEPIGIWEAAGISVRSHEERHYDLSSWNMYPAYFYVLCR